MFWRCDRTYIWEKVANYSKCPQTSSYVLEFSWKGIAYIKSLLMLIMNNTEILYFSGILTLTGCQGAGT